MKYEIARECRTYTIRTMTNHGKENIASIGYAVSRFYIMSIRGICGTSAPRYKVQHNTLESACEEAFDKWNTHGRIWIGE